MTAKEYLEQVKIKTIKIKRIQHKLDALLLLSQNCTAKITDMPKNPSPPRSSLEQVVLMTIDTQAELEKEQHELDELICEIGMMITSIKDRHCVDILLKRYIEMKPFEDIADELKYSYRWVLKLHGKGLMEITKRLNGD